MGESVCKRCDLQGINFQNVQTAHTPQYQKTKQPSQKMGRRSRHFSNDIQKAKMYMKRYCPSLVIREMQIKTTMWYHLTLVRMAIIKKSTNRVSLVAQWLRVRLPMQGTCVHAPVREDPTCRGAAGPVSHGHRACASGACAPQRERPQQ